MFSLLQGVQHLQLTDWAGQLPALLLRASSSALLSLAVTDLATAEGAAAAAAGSGSCGAAPPRAAVLHTAGEYSCMCHILHSFIYP